MDLGQGGGVHLKLTRFYRHAERHDDPQVTFQPAAGDEGGGGPPAAACLEVTAGGETQEVWLQRNDKDRAIQQLATPEGPLAIAFGAEYYPLGFALRLEKFERRRNPGGMGDASFASKVRPDRQIPPGGRGAGDLDETTPWRMASSSSTSPVSTNNREQNPSRCSWWPMIPAGG